MLAEYIYCLQDEYFRFKDMSRLKGKEWKHLHASKSQKRTELAILKSSKIYSETKIITREIHFTIIRGLIHQKNITIININTPINRAPKRMKQKLTQLKGEIDNSTIVAGNFNT